MDDHLLVEALRSRDPAAVAAVYEAFAERLYGYCWFRLRSRDAAQVALRDTFIVADAHIDRLRESGRARSWLYAIARGECDRRSPAPAARPDIPVASHLQDDVDERTLAWRAVSGLDPLDAELLDLAHRHDLSPAEIAAVVGLQPKDVPDLLERARDELDAALTAERLADLGPYGCQGRATLLKQRRGELTPTLRTALLRHSRECDTCAVAHQDGEPAETYALLPAVTPPPALRPRVLACLGDPGLVSYRLFVATRAEVWNAAGFPHPPEHFPKRRSKRSSRRPPSPSSRRLPSPPPRRPLGSSSRRSLSPFSRRFPSLSSERSLGPSSGPGLTDRRGGSRRVVRTLAVVAAGVLLLAAVGVAVMLLVEGARHDGRATASARGRGPSASPEPRVSVPATGGRQQPPRWSDRVSPTFPLGATGSSAPPTALPSPPAPPPGRDPQWAPGAPGGGIPPSGPGTLSVQPLYLDVGTGSTGVLWLSATGGPLTWQASVSGPLVLSRVGGRLGAGESTSVGVRVFRSPSSHGQATITFWPGPSSVTVTWRAASTEPPPTSPPPTSPASPPASPPPSHSADPTPPASTEPSPTPGRSTASAG